MRSWFMFFLLMALNILAVPFVCYTISVAARGADLPVIGATMIGGMPMGGGAAPVRRLTARQRLIAECNRDVPKHETQKQFERRLNLPCPGRLE